MVITATIVACTVIIEINPSWTIFDLRMTTHDRFNGLDRLGASSSRVDAADDLQRVGTQAEPDDRRCARREHRREGDGTDAGVEPEMRGQPLPLRRQHGSEHRSERAQPHDGGGSLGGPRPGSARSAATKRPCNEAACAAAEQDHAAPATTTPNASARERSDRAPRPDHERSDHRRPTAAPTTERGERRRHQCGPQCEGGIARAGEAVVAERVADEESEDCHHTGDRRLTGHLHQAQRGDRPPLQRRAIERGRGEAHRGVLSARWSEPEAQSKARGSGRCGWRRRWRRARACPRRRRCRRRCRPRARGR